MAIKYVFTNSPQRRVIKDINSEVTIGPSPIEKYYIEQARLKTLPMPLKYNKSFFEIFLAKEPTVCYSGSTVKEKRKHNKRKKKG